MILIIDNYDSFVFNLDRYVQILGKKTDVIRNDKLNIQNLDIDKYSHIILSPGPCDPNSAGVCLDLIKNFYKIKPILGVCLGHQAIAQVFGAKIVHAIKPMHGIATTISHDNSILFENIPTKFKAARYHSLAVSSNNFPDVLQINSQCTENNEIMAISHINYPVFGVQFHPESILTEHGMKLIENFLFITKMNHTSD